MTPPNSKMIDCLEISKSIGGIPELTACIVVLTGVFGAMTGHKILEWARVKSDVAIGLAIGAMFVRSLTIYMVDMKTLKQYLYLEHGAHWAIGFLAAVMFISTRIEIPEYITGGAGLVIVGSAFIASILHNRKEQKENSIQ